MKQLHSFTQLQQLCCNKVQLEIRRQVLKEIYVPLRDQIFNELLYQIDVHQ